MAARSEPWPVGAGIDGETVTQQATEGNSRTQSEKEPSVRLPT